VTSIGGRDRAGVPELGGQGGPDPGRGVGRGVLAQHDGHVQPGRVVDDLVLADLQQLRERRPQPERVDRDRASARPGRVMTSSLRPSTAAIRAQGSPSGFGPPARVTESVSS
jgi:hypothetical protein